MQEQRFKILVGNGEIFARGMTLEAVTLFVEAFFTKYNAEDSIMILRDEERNESEKSQANEDW